VLIVMKTVPELTHWRNAPPKPERRMPEAPPASDECSLIGPAADLEFLKTPDGAFESMDDLPAERVQKLARLAGITMDDRRAGVIASRLAGVLSELEQVSDEALSDVEPIPIFFPADDATSVS